MIVPLFRFLVFAGALSSWVWFSCFSCSLRLLSSWSFWFRTHVGVCFHPLSLFTVFSTSMAGHFLWEAPCGFHATMCVTDPSNTMEVDPDTDWCKTQLLFCHFVLSRLRCSFCYALKTWTYGIWASASVDSQVFAGNFHIHTLATWAKSRTFRNPFCRHGFKWGYAVGFCPACLATVSSGNQLPQLIKSWEYTRAIVQREFTHISSIRKSIQDSDQAVVI